MNANDIQKAIEAQRANAEALAQQATAAAEKATAPEATAATKAAATKAKKAAEAAAAEVKALEAKLAKAIEAEKQGEAKTEEQKANDIQKAIERANAERGTIAFNRALEANTINGGIKNEINAAFAAEVDDDANAARWCICQILGRAVDFDNEKKKEVRQQVITAFQNAAPAIAEIDGVKTAITQKKVTINSVTYYYYTPLSYTAMLRYFIPRVGKEGGIIKPFKIEHIKTPNSVTFTDSSEDKNPQFYTEHNKQLIPVSETIAETINKAILEQRIAKTADRLKTLESKR